MSTTIAASKKHTHSRHTGESWRREAGRCGQPVDSGSRGVPQAPPPHLRSLAEALLLLSRLCVLRSGSAGARWRSSPALTWATCSERPRPTRFLEERVRSSTKTTGAWRKSGWTSSKTSFTLFLLVSWAGGAGSPPTQESPCLSACLSLWVCHLIHASHSSSFVGYTTSRCVLLL